MADASKIGTNGSNGNRGRWELDIENGRLVLDCEARAQERARNRERVALLNKGKDLPSELRRSYQSEFNYF